VYYFNFNLCIHFLNSSKPAGLTVHRGQYTQRNKFVLSTLLKRQLARKVYPVHRLDHRTSGAILFAFDSVTCSYLQQALSYDKDSCLISSTKNNSIDGADSALLKPSKKEYIALLRGDWKRRFGNEEEVVVDKALNVKGSLKNAKTIFRVLASTPGMSSGSDDTLSHYPPGACSLVICTPITGRTHQIRRHAHHLGFPVIGDSQHGDTKINRWWRENRNLDRLFLHSLSLDLPPLDLFESKATNDPSLCTESNEVNNNNKTDKGDGNQERIKCVAPLCSELSNVLQSEEMACIWEVAKIKDPRLEMVPFDERGGTFGRNYRRTRSF